MQELRNEGHGHRHNAVDNMCLKKRGLCLLISTPVASLYAYGVLILYCLACAAAAHPAPGTRAGGWRWRSAPGVERLMAV